MIRRLASVATCALALTLVGSADAHAAARGWTDARTDVWTLGQTPNTRVPDRDQGDILSTTLHHRQQQVVVQTRFGELNRVGRRILVFTQLRTNTGQVRVVPLNARPNLWRGHATLQNRAGRVLDCAVGHHIDYAANVATVSIPRSCLNDPRTVQAKFGVATVDASGRAFADNPINRRDTQNLPPYTAPVRVG